MTDLWGWILGLALVALLLGIVRLRRRVGPPSVPVRRPLPLIDPTPLARDERDTALDRLEIPTKVAGVTHTNSDGSERQALIARCRRGEPLHLVPDPDNPADPNAVKVRLANGTQLGFLNARLARDVRRWTVAGRRVEAEVVEPTGGTQTRPTRGLNILLTVRD